MTHVDAKTDLVYISDAFSLPAGDVNVLTATGCKSSDHERDGRALRHVRRQAQEPVGREHRERSGVPARVANAEQNSRRLRGPPTDVTVCPDGTAYVADLYDNANSNQASVQIYPPDHTTPTGSLTYSKDFRNPV